VQIARALGAEVTGVCSAANRDLVLGLGAAAVIDYQRDDYAARSDRWDIIMDNAGTESFARARQSLAEDGRFLQVVGSLPDMLRGMTTRWSRQRVIFGDAGGTRADLDELARLYEAGRYRPVLDATFPLADARAAHARVESRRKRGSVVLVPG
jgi:NADPH:quinone reductase-like Zn-dependent oxidoreductase